MTTMLWMDHGEHVSARMCTTTKDSLLGARKQVCGAVKSMSKANAQDQMHLKLASVLSTITADCMHSHATVTRPNRSKIHLVKLQPLTA